MVASFLIYPFLILHVLYIYKKIQAQTSSISVLVFNNSYTDKILYLCFLDLRLNMQKRLMEIARILIIVICVVTMAISTGSSPPVSYHHCYRHHDEQQQQALLILKEPGCSLTNEAPIIQSLPSTIVFRVLLIIMSEAGLCLLSKLQISL